MRRPNLHRLPLAVAGSLAVLALAACASSKSGGSPTGSPATTATHATSIAIVDDAATVGAYQPKTTTVSVGTEVTWTNKSSQPHTVTFKDSSVSSSQTFNAGQDFRATFTKAGRFAYSCTIHPAMHGTVIVTA